MDKKEYKEYLEKELPQFMDADYHFGIVDETGLIIQEHIRGELNKYKDKALKNFIEKKLRDFDYWHQENDSDEELKSYINSDLIADLHWQLLECYTTDLNYPKNVFVYDYNHRINEIAGVWFSGGNFFDVCEAEMLSKGLMAWNNRHE